VLNQSYEPLTICTVKKAIILIILKKAEVIANNNGKKIRSVKDAFAWPSVIRITRYVNVTFKKVILTRKNIFRRDSYKCAYCGRSDLPLTVDHIIPRARGGEDSWENLVTACVHCNNKKGDKTPAEANLKMLVRPYKPNHIMFIKNTVGKIDDNWKPYLFIS
jgi:5-methylcytosine-specific restriction endonuclease McrA